MCSTNGILFGVEMTPPWLFFVVANFCQLIRIFLDGRQTEGLEKM